MREAATFRPSTVKKQKGEDNQEAGCVSHCSSFRSVFRGPDMLELKTLNFDSLALNEHGKTWKQVSTKDQVKLIRRELTWQTFIIDPNSAYVKCWDTVLVVALIYTLIVTPYEIALLQPAYDALWAVDLFVDACFLQDMIIQFFLKIKVRTKQGVVWIRNRRKIAARYLKTWFIADFVSIFPFDLVAPVIFKFGGLSKLKIIRVVRVLRLFKLGRILKTSRIYKRWENRISLKGSTLYMIKYIVFILISCHWMACVWAFFGVLYSDDLDCDVSWRFSLADFGGRDPGNPDDWVGKSWLVAWALARASQSSMSPCNTFHIYLASMYWAAMTMTSTGYGDILPQSPGEYVVCTIINLASSIFWAYIIGAACAVMANMDPEETEFQQMLDAFNAMAEDQSLPNHIRYRGREYIREGRYHMHTVRNKMAMEYLGPDLQSTVSQQMAEHYLNNIWFFKATSQQFREDTARKFIPHFYEPREVVEQWDKLCVVERGAVGRMGSILVPWSCWGEDMIIRMETLRSNIYAVALSFTEIETLSREDLNFSLMDYPEEISRFRKAACKMALMRVIRILREDSKSGELSDASLWIHQVLKSAQLAGSQGQQERAQLQASLDGLYEDALNRMRPPIGEAELTVDQKIDRMFQCMKPELQRMETGSLLTWTHVVSAGPEQLHHRPSRRSLTHPAMPLARAAAEAQELAKSHDSTHFGLFRRSRSSHLVESSNSSHEDWDAPAEVHIGNMHGSKNGTLWSQAIVSPSGQILEQNTQEHLEGPKFSRRPSDPPGEPSAAWTGSTPPKPFIG